MDTLSLRVKQWTLTLANFKSSAEVHGSFEEPYCALQLTKGQNGGKHRAQSGFSSSSQDSSPRAAFDRKYRSPTPS